MRKHIFFFLLFLGLLHVTYGNDSIPGRIIFYRTYSFQGSGMAYKVIANDSLVVKLKNNSFFVYDCLPGDYDLSVDKFKNAKLHLKVDEGKTYYVHFGFDEDFEAVMPEFVLADSATAYPIIYNGKMRVLGKNYVPLVRTKSRLGLNVHVGGGFDNFTTVTTTDGDNSKTSFGGGIAFGLKYGYEFTRHFDLAADLNYQFSDLHPYLENANITFSRAYLSLTPSYIFLLGDGETTRIKLGVGPDYYWYASLSIETSKLSGGINDDYKYKNALGFHVNGIFEWNISNKWSLNYGLKWYSVKYDFKSGGNTISGDSDYIHPNGSGIDFLCGFYYHF